VVRGALSAVIPVAVLAAATLGAQPDDEVIRGAIAGALIWGRPIASAEHTSSMPRDLQQQLAEYRRREEAFHSTLAPPRGATDIERGIFNTRVGIERVLYCLFPRRDIARIAAQYAADANVLPEGGDDLAAAYRADAAFIDDLLRDGSRPWLAPYLNLIAGHRKLCASQPGRRDGDLERRRSGSEARAQIARARDAGHPVIRAAADYLLTAGDVGARLCDPPR
jgi:hypothetical protein